MFNFIKSENISENKTNEYINKIEKEFNIKFPNILRNYYLNYNVSELKKCCFKIDGIDIPFEIDFIIPLDYGTMPLEKSYNYVLQNKHMSNDYIPFATDVDGDDYYWNSKNSKVYYISHENVENPILICNSVDDFFEILNKSISIELVISNLNKNLKKEDIFKKIEKSEIEKILKYNGKFILTTIIINFILIIISLLLINITDGLSIILAIALGVYVLLFMVIDIINRIKTKNELKKYDINILKKELERAVKLDKINTYLTDNYIISNTKTLKITKYSDIDWVFLGRVSGTVSQKAMVSTVYAIGGKPVTAYLKNGKSKTIALIKNTLNMTMIFEMIKSKNPNILIGDSLDTIKKYKSINPNYKNSDSNKIVYIIIFAMLLLMLIYKFFSK